MLIRLTAEQISAFWDIIKYSVENSAPAHVLVSPEHLTNVLEDLLCGTADCWVSFQRGNSNKIDGVVVTKVVHDELTKTRNLLVYSVFAYARTDKNTWLEGVEVLAKWGRSKKCYKVIGFTTEPQIVSIVSKFGGSTDTTLVMMDIDKILPEEV